MDWWDAATEAEVWRVNDRQRVRRARHAARTAALSTISVMAGLMLLAGAGAAWLLEVSS